LQLNDGIFALVDEIDFERIDAYVWRIDTNRKRAVHTKIRGVDISLHHFVLNVVGQLVDHRNGNALDNRRNNLRFATPTQNNGNRVKSIKNKMSRFKGVSLRPYGRWEATFRRKYVGSFSTEEEAAAAYDKLAREVHGEFACVNFPSAGERSAVASVTVLEQNITHDS